MHLENLSTLKDTCKIDTCDQWCKIMCDGVASAISGDKADAFWRNLSTKGHRLTQATSGARSCAMGRVCHQWRQGGCILEEPSTLKDTCKIDTCDQWCKIMCDGVASAISGDKADAFWRNLSTLKDTCKIDTWTRCKIMGNSRVCHQWRQGGCIGGTFPPKGHMQD